MIIEKLDEETRQKLIEKTKTLSHEDGERLAKIADEWNSLAEPLKSIDAQLKDASQAFFGLLSLWAGEKDSHARAQQRIALFLKMIEFDRCRDSFYVAKIHYERNEREILTIIDPEAALAGSVTGK